MFRIFIAAEHQVQRHTIRLLLEQHQGWQVSGEARGGYEAARFCRALKPDVALLQIAMPGGIEAARHVHSACPRTSLLILATETTEQVVREGLSVGARGFLTTADAGRDVVAAVEALQRRRTFFTFEIADLVVTRYWPSQDEPEAPGARLTPREKEVVQGLAGGQKTREVAAALRVSVKTVETHRANIMRKLELHSLASLTLYAARNHMVNVF